MEYNIIYKNNEAFQILNDINVHMFQNKDGSINQQVLGMYVYKFNGDKDMSCSLCTIISIDPFFLFS